MPRFHVYTNRNGRDLMGNSGHFTACWHDLKTTNGAIKRAARLSRNIAKPGDMICVERAEDHSPYEYKYVARFFFHN